MLRDLNLRLASWRHLAPLGTNLPTKSQNKGVPINWQIGNPGGGGKKGPPARQQPATAARDDSSPRQAAATQQTPRDTADPPATHPPGQPNPGSTLKIATSAIR